MSIRTFVAIGLSADVHDAVAEHLRRVRASLADLADAVSWSAPEMLHVTVQFFGDTPEQQVAALRAAVERAVSTRPVFDLDVAGFAAFPDARAPRVLCAGIGGDVDALTALVGDVEGAAAPLGFPREDKPFRPHLTVARVRRAHQDVGRTLGASGAFTAPFACGRCAVERVVLLRSDHRDGRSVYTPLWDAPLASRARV